jgi:hypothetical protein
MSTPAETTPPRFPRPLSLAEAHDLPESAYSGPVPVRIDRPALLSVGEYAKAHVIEGGWFLFFRGECCGWIRNFTSCRMNAWRPGVVAISHNPADTRVFLAVGGNYQDGAQRFQFIDPVGF